MRHASLYNAYGEICRTAYVLRKYRFDGFESFTSDFVDSDANKSISVINYPPTLDRIRINSFFPNAQKNDMIEGTFRLRFVT